MNNLTQEAMIWYALKNSLDREELMLKKYEDRLSATENSEWKDMLKDFKKSTQEHIDLLNNKMQKFNS